MTKVVSFQILSFEDLKQDLAGGPLAPKDISRGVIDRHSLWW